MAAYRRRADDPESVAVCIRCFEPRSVDPAAWAVVGPWVRETVELSAPTLHSQAANSMKVLTRLAVWALDIGLDVDREVVLTPEVLERYRVTGMRELAPTSQSTEISRLRALARAVTKRAPWPAPGERGSRQGLSAPYTDEQVEAYWEAGAAQNGPFRVQAMRAVLALAVGVGARARELFAVTGEDVVDVDGVTAVRLGPPGSERVVPVRARWVERLQKVTDGAGKGPLIASRRVGRDQASALVVSFEYPAGTAQMKAARLRSTWLTGALTDCGVAEIFAAAGISSGKALSDLLPHLPEAEVGSPAWRRLGGEQ